MLLYRYVVKELIFPFIASLSIVVFLFIMQQAIMMLDRIVSKNIDPLIVLEVFLIQLGWILALGIPMAILCAALMTFGRMAGDNEITAIKASGRSMSALMVPAVAAAAVVTVALFYFHDLILPEANHRAANLLGDISRKRPAAFIEPGVLIRDFQNYALYTEEVNSFTGDLKGIRIFSDAPGEDPMVTVAGSGNIRMTPDGEYLELSLFDGETHSMSRANEKDYFTARFATQVIYIKNVDTRFERTNSGSRGDREKNLAAMMADVRSFRESNREMDREAEALRDTIDAIKARIDARAGTAGTEITDTAGESKVSKSGIKSGMRVTVPPPKAMTTPRDTMPESARRDSIRAAAGKRAAAISKNVPPSRAVTARSPEQDSMRAVAAAKRSASRAESVSRREEGRIRQNEAHMERIERNKKANEFLIAQYLVEIHKKFAIPAACMIFVLIGAPLGIMARRGGLAVGASYSVFFFIIYWVFLISGENLADKMIVSPAVGMWSGNVFLLICGGVLMVLMLRETSISFGFLKGISGKGASVFKNLSKMWIFSLPGILFSIPRLLLNKLCGRLPTYLMGTFLGYAFGLLAALIIIFITVDYVSNMKKFEHASYYQAALFYYYYMPWIAQTVMPIVLFLSSMFAMGKVAKSSELTAMKAAGVNIRQLTMPLLVLGLLLSVGVFYGGEKIIPAANEKRALLQSNFGKTAVEQEAAASKAIREYRRNFYYFASPGVVYVFNEFCTEPQFFRGVRRYTFTQNGIAERVDAASAEFNSTESITADGEARRFPAGWQFTDGAARVFSEEGMTSEKFSSRADEILNKPPMEIAKRVKARSEMSYWELASHIDAAKHRGEKVHKFTAELEFKVAMPFMNFIVILFGLSLAARTGRRGGAALFGVGLLLSFLFWILSRFLLVFAQNGYLPVLAGAWLGNVIFFVLGLAFYRKAAH